MLNFDFFNQQAEVKRALSSRLNHTCMDGLRYQDRKVERSHFSEVVWVVPLVGRKPDFSQSIPVVSKDLSLQGLSLIHSAPLIQSPLIIGVPGHCGPSFFECKVEHCSALGFGFFQVGLFPVKVVSVSLADVKAWEARKTEFEDKQPLPAEPVA